LIYSHLHQRREFQDPVIEELLDRILLKIPVLVEHLFGFATEGQYREAIFNCLYLLQWIREGTLSDEPTVTKCLRHWIPAINLTDIEFKGPNDNVVQTNSTIRFTSTVQYPYTDLTIVTTVNGLNNPPPYTGTNTSMHLPLWPDVHHPSMPSFDRQDHDPKWYFVVAPEDSDSTISPVKIEVKGTKKISFKFPSPQLPCTISLKLHAISDTCVGLDWVSNHVLEVKRMPSPSSTKRRPMCHGDEEDEYLFGCSRNELVGFIRSLAMGKTIRPAGLEKIILAFLRQKAGIQNPRAKPTPCLTDGEHTVSQVGSEQGDEVFLSWLLRLMAQG
jgi:hypothetical protein